MIVNVQTLANKKYAIEIDEKETVLTLKQKIDSEHKLGAVEEQKLIHLGKILKNEQSIESAAIKPGAMIVLMISKIKKPNEPAAGPSSAPAPTPAQPAQAAQPPPGPQATPATPQQPAAQPPSTPAQAPVATPPAGGAAPVATAAASTLGMGASLEPMIADLMALGFPRDQVQAALRASFNNPDRAADYLFNGIPENVMRDLNRAPPSAGGAGGQQPAQQQQQQPAAGGQQAAGNPQANALAALMANSQAQQQQAQQQQQQGGGAGGAGGISANNPLAALANNPQFAAMRAMLQQRPELIPPLLQQLAQSEPQLAQLIAQNPEALAEILSGGGGGGAGGPAGGRGQTVIQITLEEKQQLDNLEALGFPRQRALEAWLACDRNEELAANYLLEHAFDDENMGGGGGGGQQQGGQGGAGGGDFAE